MPLKLATLFSSLLLLFITCASVALERNNSTCGITPGQPLRNAYGPFDYTNPDHQSKLPIVINAHFTNIVRRLERGTTAITPHGDIDYTLRAIPNYHPALYSATKLEKRDKRALKPGESYKARFYTVECYFQRALYHQPKDATTRILFAIHLHLTNKYQAAEKQYISALKLHSDNPEAHYNLGLLYVDMNKLKEAELHATKAYKLGYPLNGLKNKLARAKASQN